MDTLKKSFAWLTLLFMGGCGNATLPGKEALLGSTNREATPFVFEDCKMYYKGKEFQIGWHIKAYEKIFGRNYRRVDSLGSFGLDNVFTFDDVGIMMLGEAYGTAAQKDTIKQINIVFHYKFRELDYFTQQEGLTDKMQIAANYAWPKSVYRQSMQLNGVALAFGPQGISVQEANKRVQKANLNFGQSPLKYLWRCHVYCEPKTENLTTVYTLVVDEDPRKVQQLDISKSFGGF